ncbi:hypothetical protein GPECTOR_75g740 [Gonium pectorale]|uniref:ELMO domain-containing protein n=1 Tax=Gonium pectorale TaxID=33097 RepID=A0A150G2C2_GONPE|nr:hypothetical protein GPECTOR_75g740 [Gonium pectorale]|eukprot:KXZ44016.1 hypothetical protein GPECTOR_75g740 [Gonium pectorale]
MASLRRRRHGKDEDTLTESLLGDHEDDQREAEQEQAHEHEREERRQANRQAIIVHPGEFDLGAFVQSILDWWNRLFGQIFSYAAQLWPQGLGREQPLSLSLLQAERLRQLRERVAERFDVSDVSHQDSLRRLWSLAFPEEPCTALKCARWKDMGWQGEDPGTDFRGAGRYGLENLIYLAEEHPEVFRRLLHKTEGTRAAWEYPFAVAGLNITWALSELVELHVTQGSDPDAPPRTAAGRAFVALLADHDAAFEELYVASFCMLDNTWLEMRASYMEFNTVMKRVKAEVDRALSARPADLRALRRGLLGAAAAERFG